MLGFDSSVTKAALGGNEVLRDDSLSVESALDVFLPRLEQGSNT